MNRKLFGREPILWTSVISAILMLLVTFQFDWLNAGQAGALSGVLLSGVAIFTTRPIAPGMFTGLVTAGVALFAEYGTVLPQTQVAALNAVVLTLFTLVSRNGTSPVETPVNHA